jgi:hypothetical protein
MNRGRFDWIAAEESRQHKREEGPVKPEEEIASITGSIGAHRLQILQVAVL